MNRTNMPTNFTYESAYSNNKNIALEQAKNRLREKFFLSGQVVPASQYYHEIQNTFKSPGEKYRSNYNMNIKAARNLRHNANQEEAKRYREGCLGGICRTGKSVINYLRGKKPAQGGRKTHRRKSRSRRTRRSRR